MGGIGRHVITREESVIHNDFGDKNDEAKQVLILATALSKLFDNQKSYEKNLIIIADIGHSRRFSMLTCHLFSMIMTTRNY